MPWYYANNNQRLGPVNDVEFARLAREKIIHAETLVWRYGMPDWKTYAEVEPTLPPSGGAISVEPMGGTPRQEAAPMAGVTVEPVVQLVYAGFWIRLLAKFVDLLILSTVVMIVASAMHRMPLMPENPDVDDLKRFFVEMGALSRITLLTELLYTFFFVWRFQATPGKLLLGLQIVNPDGSRLKIIRILTRFVMEMLNRILFSFGYLSAAIDPEKRAMHDFLCETRVVRKPKK